jgi:hypothetical protein
VTVHKLVEGRLCDFTASVRWEEFYPGEGKVGEQWRKRPHNQMSVRAESHALRKAFPRQMQQAETQREAPREWVEAAEADSEPDYEAIERNARKYDLIFGPENDDLVVEPARPRADSAGAEAEVDEPPPDEGPSTAAAPATVAETPWQINSRLTAEASALGLRPRTLRNDTPLEQVEAYNVQLAEHIAQKREA